ncbi:MAG: OsmC family protein [Spirochaetes bacterium]|nr:OsmC family protein [Spirochaetota bacterium]
MAVTINGRSTGRTTVELVHESGATIRTTAPKDNGGDGSGFSPTDLCAASLGACAVTIMSMFAADKGMPVDGIEFEVIKEMSPPPRKIARLTVAFRIRGSCSDADFRKIMAAGKTCPVRLTLGDVVEIVESYERA